MHRMQKIVTCSSSFLLKVGETSCYNLSFSGSVSLVVSNMQLIVVVYVGGGFTGKSRVHRICRWFLDIHVNRRVSFFHWRHEGAEHLTTLLDFTWSPLSHLTLPRNIFSVMKWSPPPNWWGRLINLRSTYFSLFVQSHKPTYLRER